MSDASWNRLPVHSALLGPVLAACACGPGSRAGLRHRLLVRRTLRALRSAAELAAIGDRPGRS